jgi:hypothetical protein
MTRSIMRRQALIGGAGAAVLTQQARATPSSLPAQPSLLVAGPVGSRIDHWADVIASPLGQKLLGGGALVWENVGGADGVTGINQFQARTSPDGATALLLPGAALLAWLVGDTRARFDAGGWAPLWGGMTEAIVAAREPLAPGRAVRFAVQSLSGPELEALLAFELMGIEAVPIQMSAANALRRADIDAVYLRGTAVQATPGVLAGLGWRPAFAFSRMRADVPLAQELFLPSRVGDWNLVAAFQAVCAAASLEMALVLPAVVPATVLAWWRRGCDQLDDESAVRAAAAAAALHPTDAGQLATQLASVALDTNAMLSLRALLADRYHFRPI